MTRRRLLLIFTALIAALGGLWWSRRDRLDAAAANLVATVGSPEGAAAVGKAALPAFPAGTEAEHLILDIARALATDPAAISALATDDLRKRIETQVRAEHMAGDTVPVDGWELSATEARLYALVHLAG
jgi:hypothetical protein